MIGKQFVNSHAILFKLNLWYNWFSSKIDIRKRSQFKVNSGKSIEWIFFEHKNALQNAYF